MKQDHADQIIVAVLNDIVRVSLPRMMDMRTKLEKGDRLVELEIHFCIGELDKLSNCSRSYHHDPRFMSILGGVARLLFSVANLALENEQRDRRSS